MTWTLIEPGVYLIAACLPNLRPLWRRLNEKWTSSWYARPETQTSSSSNKRSNYVELGERYTINALTKLSTSSKGKGEVNQIRPRLDKSST